MLIGTIETIAAMFDDCEQEVSVVDERYCVRYANKKRLSLFGSCVGSRCFEVWAGITAPCAHCVISKVIGTRQTTSYEETSKNGRHVHGTAIPITTPDGETMKLEITLDLSERKNRENTLFAESLHLRAILNTANDGIVTISADDKVVDFNPAAERLFGYSASEVVGKDVSILMPHSERSHHHQYVDRYLETGQAHIIGTGRELFAMHKNGTLFPIHLSIGEFSDEGERFFTAIIRSISDAKAMEESLAKAVTRSEAANHAKSEFLANMSHELRTPLNAIIGFSETMKAEVFGPVGSDKYRDYLDDIHRSGRHLLEVINDILDISAVEAGALELYEKNISLADAVDASIRMINNRADKGQVTVTSTINPETLKIYADMRRMKQVFLNLLSNAVKFTPEGGEVTVNAQLNDEGSITVAVADNGIGMDKEETTKALSAFGQVDSDIQRTHEGTGLGLPLTKALVELHGGRLSISSKKGVGTVVTVYLPPERVVTKA